MTYSEQLGARIGPGHRLAHCFSVRYVIVRHGQSTNNHLWSSTGDDAGRSVDPRLTDLGHEQAAALAAYAVAPGLPWRPTHVYASAMTRAVQTAAPLAEAWDLPLRLSEDLHEVFGPYDYVAGTKERIPHPGAGREELAALSPRLELADWVTPGGWWRREVETWQDAVARADRLVATLEESHDDADVVVLVSHGWFGNVLLARMLGIAELTGAFELANTALTLIEDEGDDVAWRRTAVRVNWLPHLTPDLITDSSI